MLYIHLNLLQKVKIEIVIKDEDVKKIIEAITEIARTGNIGDGKIFISNIEDACRIRTSECGEDAL